MPEVITIGETMVAFVPNTNGLLRYITNFRKTLAGAESNVAIGIKRLGHSAGWISKLGLDEFGIFIEKELKGEGVDTSKVIYDEKFSTGVMFKEIRNTDITNVFYYRKNSAASKLRPEDIDEKYIKTAKIIHLTGITLALSNSCMETIKYVINIAKENNILLSFDPNIRLKIMEKSKIKDLLIPILKEVNILLCGLDEAYFLWDTKDKDIIINKAIELGIENIAIKLGDKGAVVANYLNKEKKYYIKPFKTTVVDSVGAGDAFNAGFLTGILEDKSVEECGKLGAIMGAFAVSTKGDYEGLPTKQEINMYINNENISR